MTSKSSISLEYVGEMILHANFDFNRHSGGSPQIGEILPLCDFFDCLVLSLTPQKWTGIGNFKPKHRKIKIVRSPKL